MASVSSSVPGGRLVPVGDTRLHVVERGAGYPLIVLHGGPGLDHAMFGHYLDRLADSYQLVLVDQRGQGRSDRTSPTETWTLGQMAGDVSALAGALGLERYAVLGHSFGAFVVLQHAISDPGAAAATIVSSGIPSTRYLAAVDENLARFEPDWLREQVRRSWALEESVESAEALAKLLVDQMPWHFRDPFDQRIAAYITATANAAYAPDVLRWFARQGYGGIEVENDLHRITQPVLVLAGRHDRTCIPDASEAIAAGIPNATLRIFEHSGHMTFVEEQDAYVETVAGFLHSAIGAPPEARSVSSNA